MKIRFGNIKVKAAGDRIYARMKKESGDSEKHYSTIQGTDATNTTAICSCRFLPLSPSIFT
jgi:hypothetical protein